MTEQELQNQLAALSEPVGAVPITGMSFSGNGGNYVRKREKSGCESEHTV